MGEKIRGRRVYFGKWSDPEGAKRRFNAERELLYNGGLRSQVKRQPLSRDVLNEFRNAKRRLHGGGALSKRSPTDYDATCDHIVLVFGCFLLLFVFCFVAIDRMRAKNAKHWGPVALDNEVNCIWVVFKYAEEARMTTAPICSARTSSAHPARCCGRRAFSGVVRLVSRTTRSDDLNVLKHGHPSCLRPLDGDVCATRVHNLRWTRVVTSRVQERPWRSAAADPCRRG